MGFLLPICRYTSSVCSHDSVDSPVRAFAMQIFRGIARRTEVNMSQLDKSNHLIRYSMQLSFLKQLLDKKLITDKEYSLIKNRLMKDYKIVSNLMA